MLPFSDIDFFLLFAGLLLSGLLIRRFFPSPLSYKAFLLGVTGIYLLVFFPSPLHAVGFVAYCYGLYYFCEYFLKTNRRLIPCLMLALPMILLKANLDLSFLSFAGLSYVTFRVIQIYLDNDRSQPPVRLFDFLLFMLFPATLLIGPVDRFSRFRSDLDKGFSSMSSGKMLDALNDLALGVFQKFILAEVVNRLWLSHIDADATQFLSMLNMMYAYSVYLYFDFAGYSNMACGLGKAFGIDVPINFNNPVLAVNPQDFWRRWHASLGEWLRDYIFRPYYKWISGMKSLKNYPVLKQNSGLFLTFLVMGCWNGFTLYYLSSGVLFGVYSVVHNTYVVRCRQQGRDVVFGKLPPGMVRGLSVFIMFNLACFALYIFSGRFPYLH